MASDGNPFRRLIVVDCASFIAGPSAATFFADLGARVVKIEPLGGDPYRRLTSWGDSWGYKLDNRTKESLALDLATPEGRDALHRLVRAADVFVCNMLPGVRDKLGISFETLSRINPRLVYGSVSGYGESGPEADRTGFETTAFWARSGLQDWTKPFRDGPPAPCPAGLGDHTTGMALFASIMCALFRREATGLGGLARTSLLGTALYGFSYMVFNSLSKVENPPPPNSRVESPVPLINSYPCGDGKWLYLTAVNPDEIPRLCRALSIPDLSADPRFADPQLRTANRRDLIAHLDAAFARFTREEACGRLLANGVTHAKIPSLEEAAEDPQARFAGAVVEYQPGEEEEVKSETVTTPVEVVGMEKVRPRRARKTGEDSRAVLRWLGYADGEIDAMVARGAVKEAVGNESKL
ncbi:putative hydroxyproline dehydratase [Hyaloraphidium curvatum]|nr:putative hydroxyproline dehydratase [Hyaloraphidium curvatum]